MVATAIDAGASNLSGCTFLCEGASLVDYVKSEFHGAVTGTTEHRAVAHKVPRLVRRKRQFTGVTLLDLYI